MIGLLGTKVGMSRVVSEEGHFIPVTYVKVDSNEVINIRTPEKNGYSALVLGVCPYAKKRKNKTYKFVREVPVDDVSNYKIGQKLDLNSIIDSKEAVITAFSKGKGFQGGVKRWNFRVARKTHGTKEGRHGSTMNNSITGRSKPGLKMSGRMGGDQVTLHQRKLIDINVEDGVCSVKGSVPGAANGLVILKTK